MKAAMFYKSGEPLKIEEVQEPELEIGEVLVKVSACGVCHTDLHYMDHGVPTFKSPPLILGHEPSGVVEEVGEGVEAISKGDRVLIPPVFTCGSCFFCRTGRENICANMLMLGNHMDGAYAEYVKAPAKDVFILPSQIPLEEGSIIADAVSTPYHAVKNRAGVQPGDVVAVFGCGGVGINVIQISAASGAHVIAVDISDKKLEWAREFGASEVVNPEEVEKVSKEIKKLTGGGADIAIEAIGNPGTIEDAFNSLRSGGRLCVIGYTPESFKLSGAKLMFREMEVIGSLGCRPVDYPPLLKMAAEGKIKIKPQVTHRFSLQEINAAFDTLRSGDCLRCIVVM